MKPVIAMPDFEAVGGAYEGASRTSREIALWQPASLSADRELGNDKPMMDSRSRDLMRNDGYILGAVNTHQDSIVGSQFLLTAKPNLRILSSQNKSFDEVWLQEATEQIEAKFTLWGESPEAYVDASRINTFTSLIRLGVGLSVYTGEILASAEWIRRVGNPFNTAIKMIDVDRLSNPNNAIDTATLSKGVEKDRYGAPIAYHIRESHPSEWDRVAFRWKRVPTRKPWGRRQIIHIFEQNRVDQTRNVGNIVSALKEMKMTKRYQDVVLQNAVMNATFAATIESELPADATYSQLGMGQDTDFATTYMNQVAAYSGGANNIKIDNARIPHLWPGQKLKLQNPQSPSGMGEAFEQSLLRHVAASLGISYEQFARDYTKTNFASARASMNETYKHMQSRKKVYADRFASMIYQLWFEEAFNKGEIVLPVGVTSSFFYEGQNKDALTEAKWLGASRGQIDPLKETQAALLKIQGGLSTWEIEAGNLGHDYRDIISQRKRENELTASNNLEFDLSTVAKKTQDNSEADNASEQ